MKSDEIRFLAALARLACEVFDGEQLRQVNFGHGETRTICKWCGTDQGEPCDENCLHFRYLCTIATGEAILNEPD